MSIELLKDLHLLTREGQLNADARRKLKQIRHLVGLLKPALDDTLARHPTPALVDCGAGKSYLGALLYELVLGPAGRGTLTAIEARPELSQRLRIELDGTHAGARVGQRASQNAAAGTEIEHEHLGHDAGIANELVCEGATTKSVAAARPRLR